MNRITHLWNAIAEELVNTEESEEFTQQVYDKFGEIFDIKDVTEYKNSATISPFFAPAQFGYLSLAIRRAFVEGYLLSRAEQRKENVKLLFNCYKDEPEEQPNEKTKKTINDYIASALIDGDANTTELSNKHDNSASADSDTGT